MLPLLRDCEKKINNMMADVIDVSGRRRMQLMVMSP